MNMSYTTTQSKFFCVYCGNEGIPIRRKKGQYRQGGHLKKLYCLNCQKETNHAEVREIGGYTKEDFDLEFKLGRFVDGERIPLTNLHDCSCECPYNINGKCWNSNKSYSCNQRGEINENMTV